LIPAIVLQEVDIDDDYGRAYASHITVHSNLPRVIVEGPYTGLSLRMHQRPVRFRGCYSFLFGRDLPKTIGELPEASQSNTTIGIAPHDFPSTDERFYLDYDNTRYLIELQHLIDRRDEIKKQAEIVLCSMFESNEFYIKDKGGKSIRELCLIKGGGIGCNCNLERILEDDFELRVLGDKELAEFIIKFESEFYGMRMKLYS
jgi:hypothetical protein